MASANDSRPWEGLSHPGVADTSLPSDSKPSNPKDIVGSNKLPLHLWPNTATIYGTLGLLDGALKYGRCNWRAVGVRASIYYDALWRHMGAWFEGEEVAPDSGVPHLGHAIACIAILIDATVAGKLEDDRMFLGGYQEAVQKFTPDVARLKALYADRNPHHYTIQDVPTELTR
jgi:hypothetical protein